MPVLNCSSTLLSTLKKNFFSSSVLLNASKGKIFASSKSETLLNDLCESSIKSYINKNNAQLLKKFINPVDEIKNTYSFVVNENVAKNIVNKIKMNTQIDKKLIIEGNPGLGLITINLVNSNVAQLYVFDNSDLQQISLNHILNEYPRVKTVSINMEERGIYTILKAFAIATEYNLTPVIIGIINRIYFLRVLAITYVKHNLWRKNFEVYLVLNSNLLNCIKSFLPKKLKFLHYCILNVLFNIEELAYYPQSAFLPPSSADDADMRLVKVTVKQNIFEHISEEEMIHYIIFINILGRKRSNFIIPTLEKWLPNCGPYLISKGVSMTNQVLDLSPWDTVTLFNVFKKCNGFDNYKYYSLEIFQKTFTA